MKVFLTQLLKISVIFMTVCAALNEITFSDEFIIEKTVDTEYKKVAWNLDLLNNNPERINGKLIFLGSSLVQGGIQDSLLTTMGMPSLNMAVPHNGNDLSHYFLLRVIEKNPKEVFVLKGRTRFKGLHKLSPLLWRPSQLIKAGQRINYSFLSYFFKRVKLSAEYVVYRLLGSAPAQRNWTSDYGFIPDTHSIEDEVYNRYLNQQIRYNDEYYNLPLNDYRYQGETGSTGLRKLKFQILAVRGVLENERAQERFMSAILKTAKNANVPIQKIYIPKLIDLKTGTAYNRMDYRRVPSDSVGVVNLARTRDSLVGQHLWSDPDHVNQKGALIISREFKRQFD